MDTIYQLSHDLTCKSMPKNVILLGRLGLKKILNYRRQRKDNETNSKRNISHKRSRG